MHVDLIKQNQLLGSWTAVLFKFLLNKPLFIRTGYDMYNFSILDKKSKLLQTMYKLLTKFSLYFANLYSVTSESDLVFLKKHFKKQAKLLKEVIGLLILNISLLNRDIQIKFLQLEG